MSYKVLLRGDSDADFNSKKTWSENLEQWLSSELPVKLVSPLE